MATYARVMASAASVAGDYVDFTALLRSRRKREARLCDVPVNNIVDDLSWNKGRHTFQVGVNWRLIHNNPRLRPELL